MIYVVCIFAILAILVAWVLINLGTSDSNKVETGLGIALLVSVLVLGICFYHGIKIPLVVVCLLIGLPMCYSAIKSMSTCSKENPYAFWDKVLGIAYWSFAMLFLVVAFYYWYYIPEKMLLTLAMSIIAIVACGYSIYWMFKQKSYFLSMMTAIFFAAIVLYYGDIKHILPLNVYLKYSMLVVLAVAGIRYLFAFVRGVNQLHEPIAWINWKWLYLDRRTWIQVLFSWKELVIPYHT